MLFRLIIKKSNKIRYSVNRKKKITPSYPKLNPQMVIKKIKKIKKINLSRNCVTFVNPQIIPKITKTKPVSNKLMWAKIGKLTSKITSTIFSQLRIIL